MLKILLGLFLGLLLASPLTVLNAQNIAITHCDGQCPIYESNLATTRSNVVVHNLYAAGLNADSGLADWVAYRLSREAIGVASLIPRSWDADKLLEHSMELDLIELGAAEFSLADISAGSPYAPPAPVSDEQERVRLAPMTSFANTPYWPDLNKLSNMVPMPSPLRLGAWLRLETALNELVAREEDLLVVTGPLFLITGGLSTNNANASFIPAAYYKVVVSDSGIATFVFPEDLAQHRHYCEQLADLEQVQSMSALELFPGRNPRPSVELLEQLGCVNSY